MTLRQLKTTVNLPRTVVRITVAVAIAGAFLFTANVIDPEASRATNGVVVGSGRAARPAAPARPLPAAPEGEATAYGSASSEEGSAGAGEKAAGGGVSLGVFEGPEHTIRVFTSRRGPVYTVVDQYGHVLCSELLAEEIAVQFPDLDVRGLIASPLIMADMPD